ncbi:GNAT family protein [Novosphingobium sp.]|uniref:GNAT family N-acetyltransferase n=1 Tax=Novosphingobium sp. TaxID=1874826 RepID=UPI00333EC67D
MIDDGLYVALSEGDLALVPLAAEHREGLRAACAADDEIWQVYPFNYRGADFDPQFDRLIGGGPQRRCFAVLHDRALVGMTAWIDAGQPGWAIEIGNSYIVPALRGTGFNRRMKQLLIDHAFACGLERVVFKVDQRNARSQAAVIKLGATREGVLRHERKTWTGWVRDTVVFSLLRSEWADRSAP